MLELKKENERLKNDRRTRPESKPMPSSQEKENKPDGNQSAEERQEIDAQSFSNEQRSLIGSFSKIISPHASPSISPELTKALRDRVSTTPLIPIYVMACDIRSSTLFLKETMDPMLYAVVLSDFIEHARKAFGLLRVLR